MTLDEAFRDQAETCTRMGSPFTGHVLRCLAESWPVGSALDQALSVYEGDIGPAGHSLPLRLAGGLHGLVLSGRDADLAALYPPNETDVAALQARIPETLKTHEDFLIEWTRTAPQTNEVRRSAALIAGAHVARAHFDRPFVISELGASGGLNLNWDRYAVAAGDARFGAADPVLTLRPDWDGPLPPATPPVVAARAGVDLAPLNPADPKDRLRLTAFLWADQPERLALTAAAAPVQQTKVEQGDAIDWLEQRLASAPAGHLHFIQHTVAWQYFPAEAQARGQAMIEAAGQAATSDTQLAWMQMETDGDRTGKIGAALTLRLWPGDITLDLGRADFHGRWVTWQGSETS
ncbi:MAG: DUF2332 family protein [Rhodobacteraceae bacterium]|nr:DUF2332 family protein [Paracoccaceae bacterium]